MTRTGERWAGWCARALDAAEREAVLGDLVEANVRNRQAIWQVLGLISRRQISWWRDWRPWLALLGIVGISGFLLNRMAWGNNLSLWLDWRTRATYGAPYENGLTPGQNEFILVLGWIAVASWSWTSGLLAGALARKTWWLVSLLMCSMWLFLARVPVVVFLFFAKSNFPGFQLFLVLVNLLVFLLPMLIGMIPGRRAAPRLRSAILLGVWIGLMAALMTWTSGWWQEAMVRWSEGTWHPSGAAWPQRSLRYVFLSWPVAYLIVLAKKKRELA